MGGQRDDGKGGTDRDIQQRTAEAHRRSAA